jgi:hypothetical protein
MPPGADTQCVRRGRCLVEREDRMSPTAFQWCPYRSNPALGSSSRTTVTVVSWVRPFGYTSATSDSMPSIVPRGGMSEVGAWSRRRQSCLRAVERVGGVELRHHPVCSNSTLRTLRRRYRAYPLPLRPRGVQLGVARLLCGGSVGGSTRPARRPEGRRPTSSSAPAPCNPLLRARISLFW